MMRRTCLVAAVLLACASAACGSDEDGGGGSGGGAGSGAMDGGGGDAPGSGGASGAGAGGSGGAGGSAGSDAGASDGAAGGATVGSPELFTESVLELDFAQGDNGRFRAGGGGWQDFEPWDQPGVNGSWGNAGVNVQTTSAVRTELVPNALGAGNLLRTWIEAGDEWKSSATYPRTELTSGSTADVSFGSEWRLEIPFYVTGDVDSNGSSILGFQFHHNGNTGSPPFSFGLKDGNLQFSIEEAPSGPNQHTTLFPLQASTWVDVVVELKFGYATDGAYVKLWANGTQYIDIDDMNVGYPDLESTAGYWKFCSLYDWANGVNGSRSVHCGPVVRFLRRP
jgi:hypothetical protein